MDLHSKQLSLVEQVEWLRALRLNFNYYSEFDMGGRGGWGEWESLRGQIVMDAAILATGGRSQSMNILLTLNCHIHSFKATDQA